MAVGGNRLDWFPIDGIELNTLAAGIRYQNREDLLLIRCAPETLIAGLWTRNHFPAAPVILAKAHQAKGRARYLLINSGNANAATGDAGLEDARRCCQAVADAEGIDVSMVLPFSTGVIGERLPVERFQASAESLLAGLGTKTWLDAASAIMTTDTRQKIACRAVRFGSRVIKLTGIAKGAGMIQPNMATMLCFIGCDAKVQQETLQDMLRAAADLSLNRITVDSDTSTNDAVVLMATGRSGVDLDEDVEAQAEFQDALTDLMLELAHGLVRDGEGATKFVTVQVAGAETDAQALEIAFSVANSPLMKTALFASDANWGRLAMAMGKVATPFDASLVDLFIGDVCLMRGGIKNPEYQEADGARVMAAEEILLHVNLNAGDCSETVWTSDLSHDYIKINAEYRT